MLVLLFKSEEEFNMDDELVGLLELRDFLFMRLKEEILLDLPNEGVLFKLLVFAVGVADEVLLNFFKLCE